jgi:hypothetical protein
MKKVSTGAAKPSKKISQQKLAVGLDLGDRNSWYCVLDESGQIQLEQRVRTNAKALQEVFTAMPRSRVALEIGTHSPWISRLLSELGHEVIVANARKVRLIGESRKKDDRLDAQTLAGLARIRSSMLKLEFESRVSLQDDHSIPQLSINRHSTQNRLCGSKREMAWLQQLGTVANSIRIVGVAKPDSHSRESTFRQCAELLRQLIDRTIML